MRLYKKTVTGTPLNTGSVKKKQHALFPAHRKGTGRPPEGHRKKAGLALTRVTGREPRIPEGEWNCINPCGKW